MYVPTWVSYMHCGLCTNTRDVISGKDIIRISIFLKFGTPAV